MKTEQRSFKKPSLLDKSVESYPGKKFILIVM